MRAAYRRSEADCWIEATPVASSAPAGAIGRSGGTEGYGARGPNWPLIAAVAALHVALIVALVKLDVIHVISRKPPPIVVTLLPDLAPPPPPATAELQPLPQKPVEPRLAPPVAIVRTSAPAPLAMPAAPPPPIAAVAVPAAPSVAPGPPAPITPPDFNADQLDNPAPRYPIESRRQHEQGTVTIKVLVSSEGRAEEIKLATSSGFDRLDKAALDAIRRWKFVPASQAGKAVEAWVLVPIPFVLAG